MVCSLRVTNENTSTRPRKRLSWGARLLLVLGAAVATIFGIYLYFDRAANTPLDPRGEPFEFLVKKGKTLNAIGTELVDLGLVKNHATWRVYLKIHRDAPAPKAGRHLVSKKMNVPEILTALSEKPIPDERPLTMVEGWRLRDADQWLAANGFIDPGDYKKAASDSSSYQIPFPFKEKTLAGYLLPETYQVALGKIDSRKLVQRQLDLFHRRFYLPNKASLEKSKRTLREVVIMASMLEREEPVVARRAKVAGVLYNRLDANTPLGVDATSRFNLNDWSDRRKFLKKLRDPQDPYNTRLNAGLPPGPIGAPSLESLQAALNPQKTKYWYYLHDRQGKIHFAKTARGHERNRKKYNVY